MHKLRDLFESNQRWAARISKQDPDFFRRLSQKQTPNYLWIGCSDSRVPAPQIIDVAPGEIFVHRNIANMVVHTDLNCLSVLHFAVEVLKVSHVIVCGHYGCGGVKAAMDNQELGLIDNWLRHIKDVHRLHRDEIEGLPDETARVRRLCELNVIEQVANVCNTSILQKAWKKQQEIAVHGWIYGLEDGILKDLDVTVTAPGQVAALVRPVQG